MAKSLKQLVLDEKRKKIKIQKLESELKKDKQTLATTLKDLTAAKKKEAAMKKPARKKKKATKKK